MADCFITRYKRSNLEFCTDGITGLFDIDTIDINNSKWKNKIQNGNDLKLYESFLLTEDMGYNALQLNGNGYGEYQSIIQPTTYYIVARAVTVGTDWSAFMGKKMTMNYQAYKYDYATYFNTDSSPQKLAGENFSTSIVTAPCDNYHVICRYNGGLILDGEMIVEPQSISTDYYGGYMELHRIYRSGWASGAWTANYLFIAFGDSTHTQEQVMQNSKYLMQKFNIS